MIYQTKYQTYKLGSITKILSNNSLSKKDLSKSTSSLIRILHYGDIHVKVNRILKDIWNETYGLKNNYIKALGNQLQPGDIVFTDASEDTKDLLKPALIKSKSKDVQLFAGLHTIPVRVDRGIVDPEFLSIYVMSTTFRRKVHKYATGTKVYGISKTIFKELTVNLPSLPEQRKIASFFSTLDDLIDNLKQQKQKLEEYKKGLMQKLFPKKGQKVPELRFEGFEGEWKEAEFKDLFRIIPSKKYQILQSQIMTSAKYPVIDQGKEFIAGFSEANEKLFTDIPVIVFGDHTTEVKYIDFPFIVGADGVKLLKVNNSVNKSISFKYLYYYLQLNKPEQQGYRRHFSLLKQLILKIPSLSEQQKIAQLLSSLDNMIQLKQEQIDKMEELKKGLLRRMFV